MRCEPRYSQGYDPAYGGAVGRRRVVPEVSTAEAQRRQYGQVCYLQCDAFGEIGTTLSEKISIFCPRSLNTVLIFPNASSL